MEIKTPRFGRVEFDKEDVVAFAEGILGFGHVREYIFVEDPHDEVFIWLQSVDSPDIAFPVLEPELFASDYKVSLNKSDLQHLELESMDNARTFNIVTIPDDPQNMTANLKAPIVVNVEKRMARQCVLQNNDLAIREPIFRRLQQRLVQAADAEKPMREPNSDVFVRLPDNPLEA